MSGDEKDHPLLLQKDYPSLRIDVPTETALDDVHLDVLDDIYKIHFAKKAHMNWIGTEKNGEHFVVSALLHSIPTGHVPEHPGLVTTKKGYKEISVRIEEEGNSLEERLTKSLFKIPEFKDVNMYTVRNTPAFAAEFVTLEEKHPQKKSGMKIGVVYCKEGQTYPIDMFQNTIEQCSPKFWEWIKFMGRRINLENWTNYRGDMGNVGETYYDEWNNVQVIYHVAPELNAEGHRRLVGNDIAVIIFLEEGASNFDPSNLSQLGTVPQIFGIVQPVGSEYRVGFFSGINIKSFLPLPPVGLIDINQMKQIVLTKMHNGLVMTNYCPPMSRLWYVPRGETLEAIVAKFPEETKKERKARERLVKKNQGELKSSKKGQSIEESLAGTKIYFDETATEYSNINALVLLIGSNFAYTEEPEKIKEKVQQQFGFQNVQTFSDSIAEIQGFIAADEDKMIIAFSGSRKAGNLRNLGDPKQVLQVTQPRQITLNGMVRKTFAKTILSIWDDFYEKLKKLNNNNQKIWLTGHSTGGAYATLAIHLLFLLNTQLQSNQYNLMGLYTYGSPKVGDEVWSKAFDLLLKKKTFRIVNNNDIVPTLPSGLSAKYYHVGLQQFLTADGKVEIDYKPKNPQKSLSAHVISCYFSALLPHHSAEIEARHGNINDDMDIDQAEEGHEMETESDKTTTSKAAEKPENIDKSDKILEQPEIKPSEQPETKVKIEKKTKYVRPGQRTSLFVNFEGIAGFNELGIVIWEYAISEEDKSNDKAWTTYDIVTQRELEKAWQAGLNEVTIKHGFSSKDNYTITLRGANQSQKNNRTGQVSSVRRVAIDTSTPNVPVPTTPPPPLPPHILQNSSNNNNNNNNNNDPSPRSDGESPRDAETSHKWSQSKPRSRVVNSPVIAPKFAENLNPGEKLLKSVLSGMNTRTLAGRSRAQAMIGPRISTVNSENSIMKKFGLTTKIPGDGKEISTIDEAEEDREPSQKRVLPQRPLPTVPLVRSKSAGSSKSQITHSSSETTPPKQNLHSSAQSPDYDLDLDSDIKLDMDLDEIAEAEPQYDNVTKHEKKLEQNPEQQQTEVNTGQKTPNRLSGKKIPDRLSGKKIEQKLEHKNAPEQTTESEKKPDITKKEEITITKSDPDRDISPNFRSDHITEQISKPNIEPSSNQSSNTEMEQGGHQKSDLSPQRLQRPPIRATTAHPLIRTPPPSNPVPQFSTPPTLRAKPRQAAQNTETTISTPYLNIENFNPVDVKSAITQLKVYFFHILKSLKQLKEMDIAYASMKARNLSTSTSGITGGNKSPGNSGEEYNNVIKTSKMLISNMKLAGNFFEKIQNNQSQLLSSGITELIKHVVFFLKECHVVVQTGKQDQATLDTQFKTIYNDVKDLTTAADLLKNLEM